MTDLSQRAVLTCRLAVPELALPWSRRLAADPAYRIWRRTGGDRR